MPSASRAKRVAVGPAAGRAAPNQWQFVNLKEPKKIQDRDVISIVRAHAMRNVRRKQRLELTAQHQKGPKALESDHTASCVTNEDSAQTNPSGRSISGKVDTDWPVAVREMLSELEMINLNDLASRIEAEVAVQCGENIQRPKDRQGYGEDQDEARGPKHFMQRISYNESPKSFLGDGVFDPFNAMPIDGNAKYHSHVLNHFASVMALNCLPVGRDTSQSPLTRIWLPYALQDPMLFLATLTFAEVHLEILSGNYKSPKTLLHKGDSIKAVNARLGDRERALSNETIGSVAMLAAMEAILGNYKELRIHMNGLQRMVYLRGGLQSLGWDGVLHMFISWQDLLSSAMMASAPRYEPTPCCLLIQGSLPSSNPVFSDLGLSTQVCDEIATSFRDMRYLTDATLTWEKYQTTLEIMSYSKMRTAVVHRLLSITNQKPVSEMTNLDYHVETCRLAALIYIKLALHMYFPICAIMQSLKAQLMNLIKQGEANCTIGVGARPQPGSITWALFMGGIISLDKDEEEWFAQRLAKGIRASGVESWTEMEERLRQICWLDKLNTPTCRSLWSRVEAIHAEYWAIQVRSVASDWDRKGPCYWYP